MTNPPDIHPAHLHAQASERPSRRAERKALRRRVRDARRHAKIVYRRGALLPRTLYGAAAIAAVAGLAAGTTTAVLYAKFDQQVTALERELTDRIERQAPQVVADIAAADERTESALSDAVLISRDAAGGELRSAATVMAVEPAQSYWLVALDAVKTATVSPPAPLALAVAGQVVPAVVWTWDERNQIALLHTELGTDAAPSLAARGWAPAGAAVNGAPMAVAVASADSAPSLIQMAAANVRNRGFSLTGAAGAVPLGAPVIDGAGGIAAVIVSTDQGFEAAHIRSACQRLLHCAGV